MEPQPSKRVTGRVRDVVIALDKGIYWLTHHWVAVFNIALLLFLIPVFAAPLLMHAGNEPLGRQIYTLYAPTCHQLPERSFFLFGSKPAYSWEELVAAGMDPSLSPAQRRTFLGSPALGFKTAVCQRDVVIYAGLLLFGALYARGGRRLLRPLPIWGLFVFLLPLAADGMTQAAGLRESTPFLRVLTGLTTAAGAIWFAYPYIDQGMREVRMELERKPPFAQRAS